MAQAQRSPHRRVDASVADQEGAHHLDKGNLLAVFPVRRPELPRRLARKAVKVDVGVLARNNLRVCQPVFLLDHAVAHKAKHQQLPDSIPHKRNIVGVDVLVIILFCGLVEIPPHNQTLSHHRTLQNVDASIHGRTLLVTLVQPLNGLWVQTPLVHLPLLLAPFKRGLRWFRKCSNSGSWSHRSFGPFQTGFEPKFESEVGDTLALIGSWWRL